MQMSRLGVALLATAATLGAGSVVVAPQAFGSTSAPVGAESLLAPVLDVLDPVLDPLDPVLDPLDPVLDVLDPVLDPLDPVLDPLDPVLDPLDPVLDPLDPVLDPVLGPVVAPVTSPTGGTGSPPVTSTTPRPTRAITPSPRPGAYAAYRIKISGVKAAKHRRSIRLLSCPAAAPKGCLVTLKGVLAGRKAFTTKTIIVMRNRKKTFSVKLAKASTKRLKKKDGSLKISARTAFSSTPSTIKRVKIARSKR